MFAKNNKWIFKDKKIPYTQQKFLALNMYGKITY